MKKIVIILCILILVAPSIAYPQRQRPIEVSIIRLIANPQSYNGRYVRVTGFVTIRFEGNVVFLHEEDYRHFLTKNALWLEIRRGERHTYIEGDQKYVLIEGTFDAHLTGHRGAYSGAIRNIRRFQPLDALMGPRA